MIGIIKWFSKDKGFGFLVDENGRDRFFGVSAIKGVDLPNNGDVVNYEPTEGAKGPRAMEIVLKKRRKSTDGRVACSNCGQKIIPRIITGPPLVYSRCWTPVPKNSICPFCGKIYKEFSSSLPEKINLVLFLLAFIIFGFFFFENFNSHHTGFFF